MRFLPVIAFAVCLLVEPAMAQLPVPSPDSFRLAEGFIAELVHQVPEQQGSWVSLATTPDGLVASDQYGQLYRIHPGADDRQTRVEPIDVDLGNAHGLLWAFDSLYVVAHRREERTPSGLYRVTDSAGDGRLDRVELLREFQGEGEHGPHAVIAGPDGKSLYICAGNHTALPEYQRTRVPPHWNEDNLLRRIWDPGGHAVGIMAPGGWICKTDPDGRELELVSVGFRNQFDIAFNPAGELFTFDADMEWDIGTPWYRPTRVCHVTSGSEFGWRGGDAKWPAWFPDSLPPVIDVGPGSPTGIVFGTGARFPEKYQRALFIADWSFGMIHAIHLRANGASYAAEREVFCSAPALQVTDMTIHSDGNLYFAIGGRRTPSALYRIRAREAVADSASVPPGEPTAESRLRHNLERYHLEGCGGAVDQVLAQLDHSDRFVRYAARTALEQTPPELWRDQAFAETRQEAVLELVVALARVAPRQPGSDQELFDLIGKKITWDSLDEGQRLHCLRGIGLVVLRHGPPDDAGRAWINESLGPHYPCDSDLINRELARLLVTTGPARYVETTLKLLDESPTQESQIHYVMALRLADKGWSNETRKRYLRWFVESAVFQGGKSFAGYLHQARAEFIEALPPGEREQLAALIAHEPVEQDPYATLRARTVVRDWTTEELIPAVQAADWTARDLENGRSVFAAAQCYKCHQFAGSGGIVGPDLTGLSRRYTTEYLLETIVDPHKAISDQYQATVFELEDGRVIVGRVADLNGNDLKVQTDMIAPGKLTTINRNSILASRPSSTSPMPDDLLNSFTEDDILDLMALLRSAEPGEGQ